jgi:hypothetical protein
MKLTDNGFQFAAHRAFSVVVAAYVKLTYKTACDRGLTRARACRLCERSQLANHQFRGVVACRTAGGTRD